MKLFKQKSWQFEILGVAGEFSNMIWGFYLLKY